MEAGKAPLLLRGRHDKQSVGVGAAQRHNRTVRRAPLVPLLDFETSYLSETAHVAPVGRRRRTSHQWGGALSRFWQLGSRDLVRGRTLRGDAETNKPEAEKATSQNTINHHFPVH